MATINCRAFNHVDRSLNDACTRSTTLSGEYPMSSSYPSHNQRQINAGRSASMCFGLLQVYDKHAHQSAAKHQLKWTLLCRYLAPFYSAIAITCIVTARALQCLYTAPQGYSECNLSQGCLRLAIASYRLTRPTPP